MITVTYRVVHQVHIVSVIIDAQTNCVCALSITLTSYFCLNTAQYIHIVEYTECLLEKFVRISGVYVHTGIRRSKQLVLTEELFTDGVVN